MYDDLIRRLRNAAIVHAGMAVLMPNSGGSTTAKMFEEAADAIEELQKSVELEYQSGFADGQISANRKKSKWISVEERLPEIGQKVLVVGRYKKAVYTGTYNGGLKMKHKKENPYKIITGGNGWRTFTYWMPLPEPPEETTDG